jgi:hypothetical protein
VTFSVNAPMLSVPIEKVLPVLAVGLVEFRSTLIVVVPPTTTLLLAVMVTPIPLPLARSCSVPPFKLSWPVPKAWRTLVIPEFRPCKVPSVKVVVPA